MELNRKKLNELKACSAAMDVYNKRPETDPVVIINLLIDGCDELDDKSERTRFEWANWLIVRLLSRKDAVRYAVFASEQVIEIFEKIYPEDKRPRQAIDTTKAWLEDDTVETRNAASAAAASAAAAYAASAADAAYAAYAAYAVASAAAAVADATADAAADAAADATAYATAVAYGTADAEMRIRILRYGVQLSQLLQDREVG